MHITEFHCVARSLSIHEEHRIAEEDGLDLTYEVWDFTQRRMEVVYESLTGLAGAKMEEEMSTSFIIYSEQY